MGTLPRFTATRALAPFGIVGPPQPNVNLVWGSAMPCDLIAGLECQQPEIELENCRQGIIRFACSTECPFGNIASRLCQACLAREERVCKTAYDDAMAACTGCPPGFDCLPDRARPLGHPIGTCCRTGRIACAANCLKCDPPHVVYPTTCTCECPSLTLCPPHKPLNPATCQCECPPCPDYRMTRDPETCHCQCPEPMQDCDGYCADLRTDELFCGSCDATPCDAFNELCCDGTCTNICTDTHCGACDRPLQPGEKCCRPQCTPTKLGTPDNCADCGHQCKNGRSCVNGDCRCPTGSRNCCATPPCTNPCCPDGRDCCNGQCCPEGYRCCGGHCCPAVADCCNGQCCPAGAPACCGGTCVDTGSNVQHCGACNNPCRGGTSCVGNVCTTYSTECKNGKCVCPNGTHLCGSNFCALNNFPVCCPPNSVQPNTYACPAGTTCCTGGQGCCL